MTQPTLLPALSLLTLIAKPQTYVHHPPRQRPPTSAHPQADSADPTLGRMTISKQFHGDLDGTSVGQMLTGMSERKGSGAYVAIEKFTGKLHGHEGTFILHHTGLMDHGAQSLSIQVVPDSGTGALRPHRQNDPRRRRPTTLTISNIRYPRRGRKNWRSSSI